MKLSLAVTSLILLAPGLVAQTIRASLHTSGNYGLFASQGRNLVHKNVAGGLLVPGSLNLSAVLRGVGGLDTIVGWRQRGSVVSVDVSEQGAVTVARGAAAFRGGSTSSAPRTRVVQGPHSLLLRIAGRPGTTGLIETWASGVTGDGVKVRYSVDIYNDGRIDFVAAPPAYKNSIIHVKIPRAGVLMVKITSNVAVARKAGTSARYKTGVSVRFTPGPTCAVRLYGESCGPRLSGRFTPSRGGGGAFVLGASRGTARGHGLLMLGTREMRFSFPGSRCPLLNDAHWVVPFRFNAAGIAVWPFRIPAGTAGDVKIQIADLSGGVIKASNGVQVVCIK